MPHDIILGLLIDGQGRVLLGRRSAAKRAYPNLWDAVGGHREDDETIAEALVREVREELGVVAVTFAALATFAEPDIKRQGDNLYHLFTVTGWAGGAPSNQAPAEHSALQWFTPAEFGRLVDVALSASLGRLILSHKT